MPENAEPPLVFVNLQHGFEGIIDAQVLVVHRHQFLQTVFAFRVKDEVFDNIQQAGFITHPAQHGVERDDTFLAFGIDALPLVEMFPFSAQAAQAGGFAVGENDQGVVPEKLGDGIFVIAQIVLVGVFELLMAGFEFDENQGQAVDKPQQVGAPGVDITRDPQLRNQQKIVLKGPLPVDHPHRFFAGKALLVLEFDSDTLFDLAINFLVGGHRRQDGTIAQDFINRQIDSGGR